MYAPHFGLKREPFSIAPDPRYLFMSERHREALAHLLYGVRAGGGFVLLTGEIGAGKTTVCRCFLEQVPKRCNVAYIFNPRLTVEELLKSVCEEFHVPLPALAASRAEGSARPTVTDYLDPLNEFLLATHAVGQNNVLIIDEAQQLSGDVLEQLRLLTNLETSERKLLQVILIGQPELRAVLARPELEQLAQRVIARYHLQAMSENETVQYVAHRLSVAGMKRAPPFSQEALKLVHLRSRGVPRRINLLCDRAMLGAYATGRTRIGRQIVEQAAAEVFDTPADARGRVTSAGGGTTAATGWPRAASIGAAALAGAVLFALASWAWKDRPPSGPLVETAEAPAASATASAASPASGTAGTARATTTITMAASAPAAAASADGVATAVASAQPAALAPPAGRSSEEAAWLALAAAWKLPTTEGDACQAARRRGLQCYRARLNLPLLRQINRPGILTLRQGNGPARYAVLEGLSAQAARLRVGAVSQALTPAELRTQWDGEFSTIWRPPPGFAGAQVEGRETTAGKWVAAKLDSLPGAPPADTGATLEPAAREAAFENRVRAFQRAQGLPADGVAGPVTLMQLNRVAGVYEPRLAAVAGAAASAPQPTTVRASMAPAATTDAATAPAPARTAATPAAGSSPTR